MTNQTLEILKRPPTIHIKPFNGFSLHQATFGSVFVASGTMADINGYPVMVASTIIFSISLN